MATDPQTLLNAAACYQCAGGGGMTQLFKLALLQQILLALNPNAMTDPASLLAQANCYQCYGAQPGIMQLFELALLAQIATNGTGGGGGGGGNPAPGVVNPNGNVTGAPGTEYFNTANSTFWVQGSATTSNTGWIQLI